MNTLKKSIIVNVPVEEVFQYLENPASILEYWPSMIDIRDIQPLPNGGHKSHWTHKMAGMRIEGISEDLEYIPREKIVTKATGGNDALITLTLEPADSGTRVEWMFEYTIPLPVIGRLAEAVIVKLNEQELNLMLINVKTRLEAG